MNKKQIKNTKKAIKAKEKKDEFLLMSKKQIKNTKIIQNLLCDQVVIDDFGNEVDEEHYYAKKDTKRKNLLLAIKFTTYENELGTYLRAQVISWGFEFDKKVLNKTKYFIRKQIFDELRDRAEYYSDVKKALESK